MRKNEKKAEALVTKQDQSSKYINFKLQKPRLFKKKGLPSLMIDTENEFLEYTFVKKRPKTITEMKMDIERYHEQNPLSSVPTYVSVVMSLDDISFVQHDKVFNTITIIGKFQVMYKNMYLEQEIVRNYEKENHCFVFKYSFNDLEKFLEIVQNRAKWDSCKIALLPISL